MGILWNPEKIELSGFISTHHSLSGNFHLIGSEIRGTISNIYGPFKIQYKLVFIYSIGKLAEWVGNKIWIMGGDFNLIKSLEEKKGGIINLYNSNLMFGECIKKLNLIDMRTHNSLFTWNNKRIGDENIASRLDRFLLLESILRDGGIKCSSPTYGRIRSLATKERSQHISTIRTIYLVEMNQTK